MSTWKEYAFSEILVDGSMPHRRFTNTGLPAGKMAHLIKK
jgi:hypothetical protein